MSTDRARTMHDREHTLPSPGEVRFAVQLYDQDGDALMHFTKDGPVEVWIEAREQPVDAAGRDGLKYVLLPLAFPNYPIAHDHAQGLRYALANLERALERAKAAASATIPTRDDGHHHVVRFARYARTIPVVAMCEICMAELVPDVKAWATDRGLTTSGNPIAEPMNLKNAIEAAVNRDG